MQLWWVPLSLTPGYKLKVQDAICGMAFGSSWHILGGIKEQIQMLESAPTGHLGDAVFRTTRPDIADATWYIFEVSHRSAH